jgi:Ca2+-binding RTX toxin-like protein
VWTADGDVRFGNNTSWDNAPFLGLYQPSYDGAVPALEVTAADLNSNVQNTYGIHSIVAVNTKAGDGSDKTYVYLVNSPDNLVQNSEAKLLAQVDYKLTASQVVVYDGATDPYNQPGAVAPVLPAAVTSVTLDGGTAAGNAIAGGYVTTSAAPALNVSFGGSLSSTDTVQLYRGDTLIETLVPGSGPGTFDPSGSAARFASIPGFTSATSSSYTVVATSVQGFTSEWSGRFVYDANSPALAPSLAYAHATDARDSNGDPVAYSAGLRPTDSLLKVSSNKEGSAGLSIDTSRVNTGLTGSGSTFEGVLKDFADYAQPSTSVSTRIFATDALGLRKEIGTLGSVANPTVMIGPSGGGTITAGSSDVAVYATGLYNTIYAGTAGFVVVDDSRAATAQVSIGAGLTLGAIDSVKIDGVRHAIESYDAVTGIATVSSTAPGALGNMSFTGAAVVLTQVTVSSAGAVSEVDTSKGLQSGTFTGGVSGASTVYGGAAGQIIYGGGGADVLHASQSSGEGGISLVAGGPGQVLRSYGNADYLFDSEYGGTTLIGGGGADTIDVTHGNNTVRFLDVADATPSAHPLVKGFTAGKGTVFDLVPALTKAIDDTTTPTDEYALSPLTFVSAVLNLSGAGASLSAGSFGYAQSGGDTYVLVNATGATVTGLTSTSNSNLEMVIRLAGTHALSASDFVYEAPLRTVTSVSYNTASNTLVVTGTGFNTSATVDVSKLTWDLDADAAATPGYALSQGGVLSSSVDSSTQVTVTLTAAAAIALEGLAGFAGPTQDDVDVAAGFLTDRYGNGSAAANNAPIALSITGTAGNDAIYGGSIADTVAGGPGADTVTLGAGSDTLILNDLTGADTVTDYVVADDSIQLSKATFTALGAVGALSIGEYYASGGATAGADATDRIVYDTATGNLYYDPDGNLSTGDVVLIGTFAGSPPPSLAYSEFSIVL